MPVLAVEYPDLPDPRAMFDSNYFKDDPRPLLRIQSDAESHEE